jgi:chemotaxis regulatin CheY-phosphate phosphatase CheZ
MARLIHRNGMPKRVLHEALLDMGVVKTIEEAMEGVQDEEQG